MLHVGRLAGRQASRSAGGQDSRYACATVRVYVRLYGCKIVRLYDCMYDAV